MKQRFGVLFSVLLLLGLGGQTWAQETPTTPSTVPATVTAPTAGGDTATITLQVPVSLLAPAAPTIETPDPNADVYPLGMTTLPYTDDKGNNGTAILSLVGVRSKDSNKPAQVVVRVSRIGGKGELEQFDSFSFLGEQMSEAVYDYSPPPAEEKLMGTFAGRQPKKAGKYTYHYTRRQMAQMQIWLSTAVAWSGRQYDLLPGGKTPIRYTANGLSPLPSLLTKLGQSLDNSSGSPASSNTDRPLGDLHYNGPVHVKSYTRKDGTPVRAHTRSAPGTGRSRRP